MRATSVIYKKLPKVNSRPLGENSPNLVTLLASKIVAEALEIMNDDLVV
jgi:hypothetical protein